VVFKFHFKLGVSNKYGTRDPVPMAPNQLKDSEPLNAFYFNNNTTISTVSPSTSHSVDDHFLDNKQTAGKHPRSLFSSLVTGSLKRSLHSTARLSDPHRRMDSNNTTAQPKALDTIGHLESS